MVPHNRPLITAEDHEAVNAVLASGWIAQGSQVAALEANFIRQYGGGGSCAVSSGTAALFLALKALGVGVGAKVAVPTYACSAILNAIYMVGAKPKIIDVLPDSFCLNPATLATEADDVDCIIAVHTYGAPVDIAGLKQVGKKIIEDCCHSLGGTGPEGLLGATGDVAIFSFYATKIVTGGQGGALWSSDKKLIEVARDFREFDCRESYVPRFNLQLTDIQAALVNSQIKRLDWILARRQVVARAYFDVMPIGLSSQSGIMVEGRMPYRYVVVTPDLASREALRSHMRKAGVDCVVPIQSYELLHRYLKLNSEDFPIAEHLVDTTLSLPIYPGLSDSQIAQLVDAFGGFRL